MPLSHAARTLRRLAFVAALLLPLPAAAQTASLVFEDVCDDPSATFDVFWGQAVYDAAGLFLFRSDDTIVPVQAEGGFDAQRTLLVIAHGSPDEVGDVPKERVATAIRAAHPGVPEAAHFLSCSAAEGENTVLKLLNAEYGDAVPLLTGATSSCALTGSGSRDLAAAVYRGSPVPSDPGRYAAVLEAILEAWGSEGFASDCATLLADDLSQLPGFMQRVRERFSQPGTDTDYLELIALNRGGTEPLACGLSTSRPCP